MTKLSDEIKKFEALSRKYSTMAVNEKLKNKPQSAVMLEATVEVMNLMINTLKEVTEL